MAEIKDHNANVEISFRNKKKVYSEESIKKAFKKLNKLNSQLAEEGIEDYSKILKNY